MFIDEIRTPRNFLDNIVYYSKKTIIFYIIIGYDAVVEKIIVLEKTVMKKLLKFMAIFNTLIIALCNFMACSKYESSKISNDEALVFVQACTDGGYEYVKNMLKINKAFVGVKNNRGDTGLMQAAGQGHKNIVELLLKNGAYIDTRDKDGDTALEWAIAKGYTDVAKVLIKKGANVNITNNDDMSLLLWAARYGQKDSAKLLIEKGADLNAVNKEKMNALLLAANYGEKDVVELLLDKGADVNAKIEAGSTALMFAASKGYKDIAELLIERGADINIKDNVPRSWTELTNNGPRRRQVSGSSALEYAVREGHEDIAELLRSKGAQE